MAKVRSYNENGKVVRPLFIFLLSTTNLEALSIKVWEVDEHILNFLEHKFSIIPNYLFSIFSLDIEGAEFAVLKTVPWDKVDIQVKY